MKSYDGLLKRPVLVRHSLVELTEYQSPYVTAVAIASSANLDTTIPMQRGIQSRMVLHCCNLRIHLDLPADILSRSGQSRRTYLFTATPRDSLPASAVG